MKKVQYIIFAVVAVVIISLSGCSHFDELNSNPTKSTNMDPALMIPTIQMRQSEDHQEWYRYILYQSVFMTHWTGGWAIGTYGGRGVKSQPYMEQMWISYYPIIIRDVVDVAYRTKDRADVVNLNSIARILKVQCFHKLTDTYGDVPYFEAGLGYLGGKTIVPYDKQEDIYNDFFKELKEAADALNPAADAIPYDLYFGGDVTKWKKYANSLRLRLAMRLVKIDPAKAKAEAEAAIADGVMESNSDICYTKHEIGDVSSSGVGKGNGIALRLADQDYPNTPNMRLSQEIVEVMENINDPRLLIYCSSNLNDRGFTDITAQVRARIGSYKDMAIPAGLFNWDISVPAVTVVNAEGVDETITDGSWLLRPSKYITAADSPYIHLSYAEVKLLMAEAAQRGWNAGGTAQQHYDEALDAAIHQWSLLFGVKNLDEAAIANFIASNALTTGNELMQINTQLWILHILDPIEAWANWRRSGMPNIVFKNPEPSVNQSNGQIPRRMQYPLDEDLKNGAAYRDALSRMGGTDDWTNRVWWDKQ